MPSHLTPWKSLFLVALAAAHSPGQTTVVDDFERPTLGPNWSIAYPNSGTQVQIVGNHALGMVAGPQGFFLANWVGSVFAADQFSEAVIPMDRTPGWSYQPYVRWRGSDLARYGFGLDDDSSQTQYFNKWYFKYDGVAGPDTRMFGLVDNTTGSRPGPGDTLRVEIRGYTLYGYWNGRLMTTATDAAANRIANGVPGLASRVTAGNQAITGAAKVWESWRGGSSVAVVLHPREIRRGSDAWRYPLSHDRDLLGRLAIPGKSWNSPIFRTRTP